MCDKTQMQTQVVCLPRQNYINHYVSSASSYVEASVFFHWKKTQIKYVHMPGYGASSVAQW